MATGFWSLRGIANRGRQRRRPGGCRGDSTSAGSFGRTYEGEWQNNKMHGKGKITWLDGRKPWVVSKFGTTRYDQPSYRDGDVLLFGKETSGLPEAWRKRWEERMIFIPILGPVRSYNLSNTVGIVLARVVSKQYTNQVVIELALYGVGTLLALAGLGFIMYGIRKSSQGGQK